jgi:hypothetical protein
MFRLETPGGGGFGKNEREATHLVSNKGTNESIKASLFKTGSVHQFSAIQESA